MTFSSHKMNCKILTLTENKRYIAVHEKYLSAEIAIIDGAWWQIMKLIFSTFYQGMKNFIKYFFSLVEF